MTSVSQIIELFGGPTRFAAVIGKNPSTASEMKRSGSIPVRYWPAILASDKGKEIGLTSDVLVAAHVSNAGSEVAA